MTGLFSSLSQIYLVSSWRVGVVIALALVLASPAVAAGAVGGAALGMAWWFGLSRLALFAPRCLPAPPGGWAELSRQAHAGLLGYNGALIGALVASRCGWSWATLGWLVVGAACGAALHLLLSHLLLRGPGRAGLPVLTAPFCAVGALLSAAPPFPPASPAVSGSPALALLGIPASFAQVSLGYGWVSGLLIVVALAVIAPRAAAWGAAAAAMTLPVLFLVPVADFAAGAWSYCAVLVGIAVGVTFPAVPAPGSVSSGRGGPGGWYHRVIPVLAGVAFALLIQAALVRAGLPVLTWPFVAATWMVLTVQGLRHGR